MTLTLFGKNLTDNETFAGVLGSGNTPGTFVDLALPQVGRTWGISPAAKF